MAEKNLVINQILIQKASNEGNTSIFPSLKNNDNLNFASVNKRVFK